MEGFYNGGQVPAHGNEIKNSNKVYIFTEKEMVEIGFVLEHVFYKKPINTKDMQSAFDIFFERTKEGGKPLSVLVEEKVKELEAKCIKMTKALEDIKDNGTSYSKMKANAVLSDLNTNPATKFTNQSTKWPSY